MERSSRRGTEPHFSGLQPGRGHRRTTILRSSARQILRERERGSVEKSARADLISIPEKLTLTGVFILVPSSAHRSLSSAKLNNNTIYDIVLLI